MKFKKVCMPQLKIFDPSFAYLISAKNSTFCKKSKCTKNGPLNLCQKKENDEYFSDFSAWANYSSLYEILFC